MSVYYLLTTVKNSTPTHEQFESLLVWLDPDRERAGRKYETIRKGLIIIFTWRGYSDSEDLADETINRVMSKVKELKVTYRGDPALYFYGVAQRVIQEQMRVKQRRVPINSITRSNPYLYDYDDEDVEAMLEALDECINAMPADDRVLIRGYYEGEKKEKIEHRKELAQKLQISESALRKRVQRLKLRLEICVKERLKRLTETETDAGT